MKILKSSSSQSIAIVPFKNLSGQANLDPVFEGLMDDFSWGLSKYQGFDVSMISGSETESTSSDFIITGSIFKTTSFTRISYKVTRVDNQKIVFGSKVQESNEELIDKYDLLVHQMVHTIKRQIGIEQMASSHYSDSESMSAYHFYLKGMAELMKGNLESDITARDYFLRAMRMDSHFSQAHSGLACSYLNEWSFQFWNNMEENLKKAHALSSRALDLNDKNYEALTILSKYYLYKGDYAKAENNIRKSLAINEIDAEILASHALTLYFLGKVDEAFDFFQKGLAINPMLDGWYNNILALLHFAREEYEECIEVGRQIEESEAFIFLTLIIAASEHALGIPHHVTDFKERFLDSYRKKIAYDLNATEEQACDWLNRLLVNNQENKLMPFLRKRMDIQRNQANFQPKPITQKLYKSADHWRFIYNDIEVVAPAMKGIEDMAMLLAEPETKLHCSELMGVTVEEKPVELIDDKAKRQYKKKLIDLKDQMDDAESFQNYEHLEQLRNEYEELQSFIAKSIQINGKSRKAADTNEKARSAITWRIRHSINKISEINELLGKHLKSSIKTGNYCYYSPEVPQKWDFIQETSEAV